MADKDELIAEALRKAETDGNFTQAEIQTLKEVAATWRGLEAFGKIAGVVRRVLAYIGWLVAGYIALRYAAADWFKAVVTVAKP